jgi:hypothetical protein
MDVHAPHEPIHTWKDFWIHLGTITIGLLVAISLEQSVEAVHHLHQRHQLEKELRGEAERNIEIVKVDMRYFADVRAWEMSLRKNVDADRANGGKAGLAYVAFAFPGVPTVPSNSVWTTAKESVLTGLLPESESAMYARMEVQHKMLVDTIDRWFVERTEVKAFEENFDDAEPTSVPDLSRMSSDELRTYSMLLTRDVAARDEVTLRLNNIMLFDQAVLGGARTETEMIEKAQLGRPH